MPACRRMAFSVPSGMSPDYDGVVLAAIRGGPVPLLLRGRGGLRSACGPRRGRSPGSRQPCALERPIPAVGRRRRGIDPRAFFDLDADGQFHTVIIYQETQERRVPAAATYSGLAPSRDIDKRMTISIRVLRARGSQAVYTEMTQIDPLRHGVFRTGRGDTSVDAARRSACATSAPADGRGWCACRSGVACSLFILNFAAWGPRVEDVLAVAGQHLLEGPIVAGRSQYWPPYNTFRG